MAQIQREHFPLSNNQVQTTVFRIIMFLQMLLRIHLIGQLLDQANFTWFYAQHFSKSHSENCTSLALSILDIFKKYSSPSVLFLHRL